MSEFCEHETFKDICGICHRDTQITALRSENERLLAANKDSMLHFDVLKADYEKLRAALQAWDDAVVVNLVMEGPRFNGVRWNKAAAAWELTRAALEEKQ